MTSSTKIVSPRVTNKSTNSTQSPGQDRSTPADYAATPVSANDFITSVKNIFSNNCLKKDGTETEPYKKLMGLTILISLSMSGLMLYFGNLRFEKSGFNSRNKNGKLYVGSVVFHLILAIINVVVICSCFMNCHHWIGVVSSAMICLLGGLSSVGFLSDLDGSISGDAIRP